jgi:hypothetical protein
MILPHWTKPANLRSQVQKLWDRGELLASRITGEQLFPRRLTLKTPTSSEIANNFDEVRKWITEIQALSHCRVEMKEFKHRVFGTNLVPKEVWIDTIEDAIALAAKQREVARFDVVADVTRKRHPELLAWLAKRPLRALDLFYEWSQFMQIVSWIKNHPRPGLYLRQVDIPGMHSKFLEAHRATLSELLDIVLSPETIDFTASGVTQFAKRYGFLDKPIRIRFRILDSDYAFFPGQAADLTLDAASFARLQSKVSRVFITENEINFLTFPNLKDSLIIFGAGYGFGRLAKAEWLTRCHIYYWGDIDTHGFAILDQLRSHLKNVKSFLMDRATLLAFESQWGEEDKQVVRNLTTLNADENALYDDLRDNRIRRNLRLEQERISFGYIEHALSTVGNSVDASQAVLEQRRVEGI